jgi:hypothetical protein
MPNIKIICLLVYLINFEPCIICYHLFIFGRIIRRIYRTDAGEGGCLFQGTVPALAWKTEENHE